MSFNPHAAPAVRDQCVIARPAVERIKEDEPCSDSSPRAHSVSTRRTRRKSNSTSGGKAGIVSTRTSGVKFSCFTILTCHLPSRVGLQEVAVGDRIVRFRIQRKVPFGQRCELLTAVAADALERRQFAHQTT
jgi:hypothetical protein